MRCADLMVHSHPAELRELLVTVLHSGDDGRARLRESLAGVELRADARPDPIALAAAGLRKPEVERLVACWEVAWTLSRPLPQRTPLTSPDDAARCILAALEPVAREQLVVVALDVRNRPLRVERVALGSVDHCSVDTREVFASALVARASSVLLGHNHPSGDPTPSQEDVALTNRVAEGGRVLGLPLLDHVIVVCPSSPPRYTSLAALGHLRGVERGASALSTPARGGSGARAGRKPPA